VSDCASKVSGTDAVARRVKVDGPDGGLVPLERRHTDPVVPVLCPQLDGVVIAARHERVLGGVPLDHLDVLRVLLQHGGALKVVVGLDLPHPHALVAPARGQQRARGGPCHALDLVLVALQVGQQLVLARARVVLPHGHGRVKAGRGELARVGRERDRADRALVRVR